MSKRSANTYQKINTVFFRDTNDIIMPYDTFVTPELEYLRNCQFECTEKIDGTNMRIEITHHKDGDNVVFDMAIKGKTDNATVPVHLMKFMTETFPKEKVCEALGIKVVMTPSDCLDNKWLDYENIPNYTIYGEGYGMKIQKGGNYIKNGVNFIVFDIKVNDIYLMTDVYQDIAKKMNADIVPFIGMMTIDQAIDFVKTGFKSTIAENKDYDAEGLVLKTPLGLKDRLGKRIIVKVKTVDFRKYFNKYNTYDKVPQIRKEMN